MFVFVIDDVKRAGLVSIDDITSLHSVHFLLLTPLVVKLQIAMTHTHTLAQTTNHELRIKRTL